MGWEYKLTRKLTRNPLDTLSAPLIPVAQWAGLVTENRDEPTNRPRPSRLEVIGPDGRVLYSRGKFTIYRQDEGRTVKVMLDARPSIMFSDGQIERAAAALYRFDTGFSWDEDANSGERNDYRESVRLVLESMLGDVGDASV